MKYKFYFKSFLVLVALMITFSGYSQNAGISATGAIPPNAAAGLDVNFTDKGLLIPRVALLSTTSSSPLAAKVNGMLVYNTATTGDVVPGFYYNDGSVWVSFLPKTNVAGDMQYWNGSDWVSIPVGTSGQSLLINGAGVPEWGSPILATISTTAVSGITAASAASGGTILNDGGSAITMSGICWASTPNPTIADFSTADGTGIGVFTSNMIDLTAATTYYVRAYAINASGPSYGNQVSFTTLP